MSNKKTTTMTKLFVKKITNNPKSSTVFLWLHGWGLTHKWMQGLASEFADQGINYLPDFPGFGQSEELKKVWSMDEYVEVTYDWISKNIKKNQKLIIIGHSFGARVMLKLFFKYPNIEKFVFIGGAGIPRKRSLVYKIKVCLLKCGARVGDIVDKTFKVNLKDKIGRYFRSSDYRDLKGFKKQSFLKIISEDFSKHAVKITIPTLLIYGRNDNQTPVEVGQKFNKLIPKSKLCILENFGHNDVLIKGQHQVVNLIQKFIKE